MSTDPKSCNYANYEESNKLERMLGNLFLPQLGLPIRQMESSTGFAEDWDIRCMGIGFEIKAKSKSHVFIELARGNWEPSGFATSTAQYACFLTIQEEKRTGIKRGKVRLFKTQDILDWAIKEQPDPTKWPLIGKDGLPTGSRGLDMYPKEAEKILPHLWLGDLEVRLDSSTEVRVDRYLDGIRDVKDDIFQLGWRFR